MKKIFCANCIILCLISLVFTNNVGAAFLYWNNNGTSVPTNGTWDLATSQWATDSTATASPVVWDPTAGAVFSVTNTGVPGYLGNLSIGVNSAIGIAGIYNNGTNGSTPATNLIFTGTGSFVLAADTTNVIAAGNGNIGAGGGNNNIFYVPITGLGSVDFQAATGSEYLAVSNSYSGGTTISTGNGINFSTSGVFGTGPITIAPSLAQIVWATPIALPASAGGAPFATNNPITIPNNLVANTAGPFRIILVGNASAPITFSGNWDLGIQNTTLDFRTTTITNSGIISGSGSLTKIGTSGILVLSGSNTYSGKTLINVGTISASSINSVNGGSASSSLGAPTTVANGTISLGTTTTAGTLIYTGAGETTDRIVDLAGTTGGGTIQNDGTGALIFTNSFTATGAGAKTLLLTGVNASSNEVAGVIVDNSPANPTSLTKNLQGVWKLSGSNTFSGKVIITRGTLSVSSLNSFVGGTASSSLGAPTTLANATINLGGGTTASALIYTGAGETSDRVINLTSTTGGCTIQSDGSGPLVLTSDFTVTGQNNKTLTLSGSNTGDNRINGKIVNFNATTNTAVTKSGAGTWILAGSNTFAGNMSFNAGLLKIANPAALGFGTNVIGGNGSFDNVTGADLTITNALTLSAGSPTYVGSTHNVTYTGPVTISGANRSITVTSNTMTLNSGIGDLAQGRGFTKAGAGTLRLLGVNTYTGNTAVNAGTLILGASASFATLSNFTIAASGTLDCSAIAAFTVPGTNTFTATGSNTVEGVSAAVIKGGTTVDLGTRPISLTFTPTNFTGDTGHPSLIVSQGALWLGGNAFTVNNASGVPLGAGTYQLISQTSGSILSSGTHTVTVTGSNLVANATAEIVVSGGNVNMVVTVSEVGATISTPTILTNGSVQLNFTGTPNAGYIVEGATNLNTPITWIPLSTNTADGNGLFNYTDTEATNYVERYYRAKNQ